MTKTQENKRLRQIRRIHNRMKKISIKEKDLTDYVIPYSQNDIDEEYELLNQHKADCFINHAED